MSTAAAVRRPPPHGSSFRPDVLLCSFKFHQLAVDFLVCSLYFPISISILLGGTFFGSGRGGGYLHSLFVPSVVIISIIFFIVFGYVFVIRFVFHVLFLVVYRFSFLSFVKYAFYSYVVRKW